MIQGAIFDLDGTLLDSMSIWDRVGEDYLRSLGKEPKDNLKEVFKTFTLEQSAQYYIDYYGVTLSVEEIVSGINKMVENYYVNTIPLKPGVEYFLKELYTRGIKMCIATVTHEYLAKAALDRLKVSHYFTRIITCAQVGHSKKEPHIYRQALQELQTGKNETVVFEDTLHAVVTAKSDGFITCGVYDEHEFEQEKLKSTASLYIKNYLKADEFWQYALS